MAGACEAALVAGLAEIAFADHADFEPSDDCYGYLKPQAYLEEIARCRAIYGESLTIRAGIEIGEPHVYNRETAAFLSAHRFDLVLGSLHWVEGELALMGDYFASRTLEDGLRAYFAELALLRAPISTFWPTSTSFAGQRTWPSAWRKSTTGPSRRLSGASWRTS
jgi:histidinol-phosphatase (PHP family)